MTTQSQTVALPASAAISNRIIAPTVLRDNLAIAIKPNVSMQGEQTIAQISPPLPASPLLNSPFQNALIDEHLSETQKMSIASPEKGGETGKGGFSQIHSLPVTVTPTPPSPVLPPPFVTLQVTNAEFVSALFHQLPIGAHSAVCSKPGDPTQGGWVAKRADKVVENIPATHNNYLNCSSFNLGDDGFLHARKDNFAAYHLLMLDDIGTKVSFARLNDFDLSYLLETSPGNYQGGIILAEPIINGVKANQLLDAVIIAGLCDAGATGAQGRWARLPVGINGKAKHVNASGEPFQSRLVKWAPERVYTPQEIIAGLQLELLPADTSQSSLATNAKSRDYDHEDADEVFTPKSSENPVIKALKARGLYKTPLGSGKHDVTCPWLNEHTDALDSGTAFFEPNETYLNGGFRCQHSHGEVYKTKQFFDFLGITKGEAKHKPVIRIVEGELHHVVNTAERELAKGGRHYQAGGLIVTISTNPETGDPSIVPINVPALTKELSICAAWEKFSARAGGFVACDPPARHIGILSDSQTYAHLPHLLGVARQPYFRESDGILVTQAGYDKVSKRFGVFDARKFVTTTPTIDAAHIALALLNDLLTEFSYATPSDKSAALSAIFTAVTRTSYAYAPAFHTKASTIGSGKTYQNELISAFAKPGLTQKVSYPTTGEEATKSILALLLPAPAVIEFDDMATDWIPHGIINRALTAESITDRILGVSKTATVSTRTLFLSSGNNVGPVRDLLRRVITISIDHRCATPATKSYKGLPVETVRRDRGRYVAAVLTIILAWKAAGSPRAAVENIATYGGAWADYCRHTLIWLGQADPATSLLDQVKNDPDADALLVLMTAWHKRYGSTPTTVRKVIRDTYDLIGEDSLRDAICEFPVEERGNINPSKFGWILKKNANRIVGDFIFKKSTADGRVAWMVTKI
ncbi:DNA-primase RepB domain-containing protein [Methylotenera versatilis]|uniref:DNA-primase RepB domain-containing protein n=1 Tax=Methylotenera versatilis TaxID=1055487 RepID=UPI00068F46B5|nr:DNA-primase RepB domain-containing protein [Methylotenera versatilis]